MHMNQWQEKKKNSKILSSFFQNKSVKIYRIYIERERERIAKNKTGFLIIVIKKKHLFQDI